MQKRTKKHETSATTYKKLKKYINKNLQKSFKKNLLRKWLSVHPYHQTPAPVRETLL